MLGKGFTLKELRNFLPFPPSPSKKGEGVGYHAAGEAEKVITIITISTTITIFTISAFITIMAGEAEKAEQRKGGADAWPAHVRPVS